MRQKKKFKDLNLKDAFLFSSALADSETCRLILEIILGKPIPKLTVHAEHNLLYNSDVKNVRLDVYAHDAVDVVYDLEMQQQDNKNLPKRSRYYQGQLDMMSLEPGEDFHQLSPSYVIFICTFDPFGENLYRYTFEEYCKESSTVLGSETTKIFLNTKGMNTTDVPEELIHLLEYVENSTDKNIALLRDEALEKIHERVKEIKTSRELEVKYVRLEEYLKDWAAEEILEARAEAKAECAEEEQKRMLLLLQYMDEDDKAHEILRLTKEPDFLKEMLKRYNL